jgi:hypothetical protein
LFTKFGSDVEEVTEAVFITEVPPGAVTVTVIVTWANPPGGMDPRLAITVPLAPPAGPVQLPWLVVQAVQLGFWTDVQKVVPAGKGSVTTTLAAALGPLLVTPIVKVSMLPDVTGFGEAVFVMTRSAVATGVLVGVSVLVGVTVIVGVGVGATVHGNLYWKAPGEVVVHVVKAEVTVTSTAAPTFKNVPAGVPAGQAGAVAPLSGTVTMIVVGETAPIDAARPPKVTLVTLPRFAPLMVTTVPGDPEFGLTEVMIGFVTAT